MKILSFDVGIVNLAYCIIESLPTPKLIHWEIITLSERGNSFSAHISTSGIADLYLNLINQLDQRPHLLETDIVLIEKQPSFNPKMRIIAGCLQTYFYIRGVVDRKLIKSVEFFSPKHKLKCYTGPELDITSKNGKIVKGKYAQTKKMGVAIAKLKLEEYSESESMIKLFEISKKKDDLSDCYLQALTYILFSKNKEPVKIKTVKLTNSELKKKIKDFLELSLKNCSVLEIMNKDYKSIHEIEFPFELNEPIESILTKFSLKKYTNLKYN